MVTVFTDGVFDLFHANHVALLHEAQALGDRLVVGVVSDKVAQGYKRAPVICEAERLEVVANITCVDEAFIIDADMTSQTMDKIVDDFNISLVVYAGDATPDFYSSAEAAGIMPRLPYHVGVNTSDIIQRIREQAS